VAPAIVLARRRPAASYWKLAATVPLIAVNWSRAFQM
jgi:hypothetical protein